MSSGINQPVSQTPAKDDSAAQNGTFPVWLIIALVVLLYWAATYFDEHGGWFEPKVYEPFRNVADVTRFQPQTGNEGPIPHGREVYGRTCVVCHQADGRGTPGTFPPLAGSDWVNEKEPGRVIRIVLQGAQGPIKVSDHPFNNTMVPWNSLSDVDIAAVISFVRSNKEWGNNASIVTPAQVKAIREKVKGHPLPFAPDELLQISPAE
jgi:mono/diheme cytochrome c family protein